MKKYALWDPAFPLVMHETLDYCIRKLNEKKKIIPINPEDKHILYGYHDENNFTLCEYHFPDDQSFEEKIADAIKSGYQIYAWHKEEEPSMYYLEFYTHDSADPRMGGHFNSKEEAIFEAGKLYADKNVVQVVVFNSDNEAVFNGN